jgi:hypothetical protein
MVSFLEQAREEMKRADHLLYVSLKYTRTVDVLKSLIDRLVSTIDVIIDGLLEYALEKKMIPEKPDNLGLKGDLVKKTFKDPIVDEMVNFSLFMKQLNRAEYKKTREFRRHVTMSAVIDIGIVNVDIDTIKEDYFKTRSYMEHAETIIFGEKEVI